MAKLLSEKAKEINATEVKIRLNQIINKDAEFVGNVEVTWNYGENATEMKNYNEDTKL